MTQKTPRDSMSAEELFRDAELREERGDFRGAFKSLLIAAQRGDLLSSLNLGNYYAVGHGVRRIRARPLGGTRGHTALAIPLEP